MKIRISGTIEELEEAKGYYAELSQAPFIKSIEISRPYKNRGSDTIYRLYIDIAYYDFYLLEGGNKNG